MTRLHIRCDPNLKEAYQAVCEGYGVDMSTLLRAKVREIVKQEGDKIPDEIQKRAEINRIKSRKTDEQNVMHLPNNLFQQVRRLLEKRFPPHPDEIREEYYKPYKEQIEVKYDDEGRKQRKIAQLQHVLRTYKRTHPETRPEDTDMVKDAVAEMAYNLKREENMETARNFIKRLVSDGVLPDSHRDETIDTVREMNQNDWKTDWDNATLGEV